MVNQVTCGLTLFWLTPGEVSLHVDHVNWVNKNDWKFRYFSELESNIKMTQEPI